MATIKDIARELNIGVSTVSMALNGNPRINEETRQKVLAKAKELNYVKNGIAVDLQRKSTNLILLVVDDASRPFFSRTINAVQRKVSEYGYDLLIATTFNGHIETAKRYISERRADGVIVFTNRIEDEDVLRYACKDMPIFVIGRYLSGEHVYSEPISSTTQGQEVVEYLYNKGYRKIAFVKALSHTLGTIRRFNGYQRALANHHLEYNEEIVFNANGSEYEDGYRITKEIIKKIDQIDAIFYSNDDIAIPGVKCLIDHGIAVPQRVSVVGYNDLPYSKLVTPALTTVTTCQTTTSYAVDILIAAIRNENVQPIIDQYVQELDERKERLIIRET